MSRTPVSTHLLLIALLAALALLAAGCAGNDDSSGDDSAPAPSASTTEAAGGGEDAGEPATASLEVRLEKVGDKGGVGPGIPAGMRCTKSIPATCNGTVECPNPDPSKPGGTPDDVCAWLAGEGFDLLTEEVPEREVCTEIYGGPSTAHVTGTVEGEQVDATFSRENGCAIARWDAIEPLWTGKLPDGGDAAGAPPTPTSTPDAPVSSQPQREPDAIDDPPEAFDR